jgi:hypothetical protein
MAFGLFGLYWGKISKLDFFEQAQAGGLLEARISNVESHPSQKNKNKTYFLEGENRMVRSKVKLLYTYTSLSLGGIFFVILLF